MIAPLFVIAGWAAGTFQIASSSVAAPIAPEATVAGPSSVWGSDAAFTVAPGRIELGLFSVARVSPAPDLELSLQPLLFAVLPHLELKRRWGELEGWQLASRHRVAFLTGFLHQIAREGTAGLLPADTDVPFALALDNGVIASKPIADQIGSVELSVQLAPHGHSQNLALIDLPFLYPRFAALDTVATFALSGRIGGPILDWLDYRAELLCFLLPGVAGGIAGEHAAALQLRPSSTFTFELGYRLSLARYPVGVRFHALPTFDLIFAFD